MTGRRLAEAGSDSGGVVATGRTRGRVAALGGEADVELVESMAGSDEKRIKTVAAAALGRMKKRLSEKGAAAPPAQAGANSSQAGS